MSSVGASRTIEHATDPVPHRLERQVHPVGDFTVGQPQGKKFDDFDVEIVAQRVDNSNVSRHTFAGIIRIAPEARTSSADFGQPLGHIAGRKLRQVDDVEEAEPSSTNVERLTPFRTSDDCPSLGISSQNEYPPKESCSREPSCVDHDDLRSEVPHDLNHLLERCVRVEDSEHRGSVSARQGLLEIRDGSIHRTIDDDAHVSPHSVLNCSRRTEPMYRKEPEHFDESTYLEIGGSIIVRKDSRDSIAFRFSEL